MIPTSPGLDLAEGFAEQMGRWCVEHGGDQRLAEMLCVAARQACLSTSDGHACVPLSDIARTANVDAAHLRERLLQSGLVGAPADQRALPLILDDEDRLYLGRYFDLERRLAAELAQRAMPMTRDDGGASLRARLDALFADNAQRLGDRPDWQRLAVALAMQQRLVVISGGPGTGKTTTVVALLGCLLDDHPTLRVALAAPTGKAAARMQDAIRARATLLPPDIRSRLPGTAYTIHRLLGVTPDPGRFRHHAGHRLPFDVLIVDEASMLDLALATRLVEALRDDARLVLLGDKDQLSAVEAGAVFAELSCDPGLTPETLGRLSSVTGTAADAIRPAAAVRPTSLPDTVVWLSESHRFGADSAIGRLARAVNAGHGAHALREIAADPTGAVRWIDDHSPELSAASRQALVEGYQGYLETLRRLTDGTGIDPVQAFEAFDQFRVLCAIREGRRGVAGINALVSQQIRRGLDHPQDPGDTSPWYPGRAVIVQRNEPMLKLYNGDVGLCLPDPQGRLLVWFPDAEHGHRAVAPVRMPEHDTAFAITVHKSQGSEFRSVMLLMPQDDVRVATRALVYTAITRASASVTLVGSEQTFEAACRRITQRRGGLQARIAEALQAQRGQAR